MNSSKLDPADIGRAARHWLGALQDRLAGAFGILPSERPATVVEMLHRSSMRAPSYWLQLVLSMGIATLGLVLGSTAVVIGAMLVSPLMGPIIELGMGLAVGSPFLVARSILRTVASIACVVLCSALISWLAPFHEVTPEIAARTTPNVLDLLIAALCAVAAAYTATQRGADTAATAAGTAIGIALVPPLCVVGYGVGSGSTTVSGGAALLFVANFSAIVLLAVLVFILFGYGRVDTTRLEAEELADPSHRPWIRDGLGWLNRVLRSRFGPLWRVLLPAVLVATVSVPLRSALAEVTWQVRVRTAVQGLLRALPKGAVRTSVNVERGNVAVRLMLVGTQRDARALEARLSEEVRGAAGVDAVVEVIPVPNEAALREAVAAARMPVGIAPTPERVDVEPLRKTVRLAVNSAWPTGGGRLLRVRLDVTEGFEVEVVHFGRPVGEASLELLSRAISRELGVVVTVRELAVMEDALTAPREGAGPWLASVLSVARRLEQVPSLRACAVAPEQMLKANDKRAYLRTLDALRAEIPDAGRLTITPGELWSFRLSDVPCDSPAEAPKGASGVAVEPSQGAGPTR